MPAVQYDDRAAAFFSISLLSVFAVPSAIYIARTALAFRSDDSVDATGAAAAATAASAAASLSSASASASAPPSAALAASAAAALAAAPRSQAERDKQARLRRARPTKVLWTTSFQACTAVTAVALAVLVALVMSVRNTTLAAYDPYAILGIAIGSSDREIKQAYRGLSRTAHPDKGGDAETFQKISKAYESLTDPEARANWEKFGNPDGKQALEVAIGIPSFLLHPQARYLFLLGYLGLLVLFSLAMRRVWTNTKGKTVHNLQQGSLVHIQQRVPYFAKFAAKALPEIYSSIEDLSGLVYAAEDAAEGGELHAIVQSLGDPRAPRIFFASDERNQPMVHGVGRNNTILLHAHMNRHVYTLVSPRLQALLPPLLAHVPAFVAYTMLMLKELQHQHQFFKARRDPRAGESRLELAAEVLRFGAQCVQGLYGRDSSLLQLLSADEAAAVLHEKRNLELRTLLAMPEAERAPLLARALDAAGAGAARRAEVARVMRDLPVVDASLTFGVNVGGAAAASVEGASVVDGDGLDVEGGDGAVGSGKAGAPPLALQPVIYEKNFVTAHLTLRHRNLADDAPVPPVHAPYFPLEAQEEWHVWVLDERDLVMHLGEAEEAPLFYAVMRPKRGRETLTIASFPAPKADSRRLVVRVRSAVYLGLDAEAPAHLTVRRREDEPAAPGASADDEAADAKAHARAALLRVRARAAKDKAAKDKAAAAGDAAGAAAAADADEDGDADAAAGEGEGGDEDEVEVEDGEGKGEDEEETFGGAEEIVERLFANEDVSDVSDADEDADAGDGEGEGDGKAAAKGKGAGAGAGAAAGGASASPRAARTAAAAAAGGPRTVSLADDDDGWAPSILAGAAPRRKAGAGAPASGAAARRSGAKGKAVPAAPLPSVGSVGGGGGAGDEDD